MENQLLSCELTAGDDILVKYSSTKQEILAEVDSLKKKGTLRVYQSIHYLDGSLSVSFRRIEAGVDNCMYTLTAKKNL